MTSSHSLPTVVLACLVLVVAAPRTHAAEAAPPATSGSAPESADAKPNITHAPYGDVNVVVPLTSDDKGLQAMKLRNIANTLRAAETWGGRFTIKVVLYAKGVALLKNPDDATKTQLDVLRSKGVQVEVCANTLSEQGLDFHSLYHVTEADIVPSGFAEVAYQQARRHFVVDPVN